MLVFEKLLKSRGFGIEPKWCEKGGIIYFSVTSDGTTGSDWISRLENKGCSLADETKKILYSPDFKSTNGVTTEVAVLTDRLFKDKDRSTKKICAEADKRNLSTPNAELACLTRENFGYKESEAMGLISIVVMHQPVINSHGEPSFLNVLNGDFGCWIDISPANCLSWWSRGVGFAFEVAKADS